MLLHSVPASNNSIHTCRQREAHCSRAHNHRHQVPAPHTATTSSKSSSTVRPALATPSRVIFNGAPVEVEVVRALHHEQQEGPQLPQLANPGDLLLNNVDSSTALSVLVQQPTYQVVIQYKADNRLLQPAQRVWAHVGHSGWQYTLDVELYRNTHNSNSWTGIYKIPASQLATPSHVEVQIVFKGLMPAGHIAWDNNDGNNYQVVAELGKENEGLVHPAPVSGAAVSGLVLLLQALRLQGLLSVQQEQLLRLLAWQRDGRLMRVWDAVRHWADLAAAAGQLLAQTLFARRAGVHVMHVTSEMVPLAKVGGLGDVVTSLAKAHQATGTLVEIIMPKYDCANYVSIDQLRTLTTFDVAWEGKLIPTKAWCGVVEGLPVYLLEPQPPAPFFWRGRFYGESDDVERFLFFSRAALDFMLVTNRQPDVVHLHDWQSSAVAPLLAQEYRQKGLQPRTVLTIHNIAFQGWMTPDVLAKVGLDPEELAQPLVMLDDSRPGFRPGAHDVSLMRGGVVFADRVTTVSPTYACEVYQPEFGFGMQSVLERHSGKFSGVLNGIDHQMWNPSIDTLLPPWGHYSAAHTEGKQVCKQALLHQVGLPYAEPQHTPGGVGRPLMVIVSRLTQQKGLPLMLHGIKTALARGAQVVVLGSASEQEVQNTFERLASEHGSGGDARFVLRYDEGLAHRIYAAADLILIPSFFEPCGLTQLIALRYGTIPVVNATGGLADTVFDVANSDVPESDRNGFVFYGREPHHVETALNRALDAYYSAHGWWREELVPRVMQQDFSWSRSSAAYLDIYRSML